MSTAEYPDALTRRIEQLAAAVEEPEGDSSAALTALVGALRAEIGGVRAELGALRSETGAVRSDLDGLGGRLTGSVAASRTETGTLVRRVAELATRVDGVGGRVDDVRNGLPSLTKELREGLDALPTRTTARLDELSVSLTRLMDERADAIAADIHRTMAGALERDARTAGTTATAMEDARVALESRLAMLEDTLHGMTERIEALSRDGASTTTSRLEELAGSVGELDRRIVDDGRDSAELLVGRLREVTDTRMGALEASLFDRLSDVLRTRHDELRVEVLGALESAREDAAGERERVQELEEALRGALAGLGGALDRSLTGLGTSVTAALTEAGERHDRGLVALHERLDDAVGTLATAAAERDQAQTVRLGELQVAVERRLDQVRGQVSTGMTALRGDVGTELGQLAPRIDELAVAGSAQAEAVRVLRTDVVGTVSDVSDRLLTAGSDNAEVLRGAMTDTRGEIAALTRALRKDLLDRIEEKYAHVADRLAEAVTQAETATSAGRGVSEHVAGLLQLSEELRLSVGRTRDDVLTATDGLQQRLVEQADTRDQASAARLEGAVGDLGQRLEQLAGSVDGRVGALDTSVSDRVGALDAALAERLGLLDAALSETLRGLTVGLTGQVEGLRAGLDERVGVLTERVAASTDSTRESADRVATLVGVTEAVREDVVEAGRDLRAELLTRSGDQLAGLAEKLRELDTVVDESSAAVAERIDALEGAVTRGTAGQEQVTAGLAGIDTSTRELTETVAGFRTEWPTRTFEVVQGAKAVAEGVVGEVRNEVRAQLEQIQAELERAVVEVSGAGEGLRGGTARLTRAGQVLVAYLEQRDLLLEAERDRTLHEVLDAFAAGLSAKDRTALSGRVSDAVARRRDARDAERFRSAAGVTGSPTADLPDEVRDLVPGAEPGEVDQTQPAPVETAPVDAAPDARAAEGAPVAGRARPASRPAASVAPRPPSTGVTADPEPSKDVAPDDDAPTVQVAEAARPTAAARTKAPAKARAETPAKERTTAPAKAKAETPVKARTKAPAKARTKAPAPDEAQPAAGPPARAPRSTRTAAASRAGEGQPKGRSARGRLAAMPEVPSVDRALAAAASDPEQSADPTTETSDADPTRREVPEQPSDAGAGSWAAAPSTSADGPATTEASWASRPAEPSAQDGTDDDLSVRRLFRRKK